MNITPRQHGIVDLARQNGFQSVETLAERFAVTPQTIRRDINSLCDANLLRRRRGGADYMEAPRLNQPYDSRRIIHPLAKQAIGALVAGLIPNGASVSFGIGTTPEFVALAMQAHEDLTVVTNNLNVALALSVTRSNRIILPGGTMRLPDRDMLGPQVEEMYRSYRVDFGVFGVGGIEADGVLVDFDRAEVLARAAMRESCRRSVLVADVSKLGRPAPVRGGHLADVDMLVLDAPPPADFAALFDSADHGARLRVAASDTSTLVATGAGA
ncbi:DeoR family transcriptional regulator [Azorhizobium oxalatiphilum]|uniref:DeoR family transcriptional regulator n=1 Tax=Azorhizobium oxalatiphilum TaxID=980631 RepID=A0A917BNB6_9HYPH|nr:DeoR/GlpR family DNA-binding transcription regulator [Azorhizobium oxalatiphilum]GGF51449.1 DeoR family transcriptional regulator [Azorhizobium oxalatiphilum]